MAILEAKKARQERSLPFKVISFHEVDHDTIGHDTLGMVKECLNIPPQDKVPSCLWVEPGRESMDGIVIVGRGRGEALGSDSEGLEMQGRIHDDRNQTDQG